MYRPTRPLPAYTLQRRQLYANLSMQLASHGLSTGMERCPSLLPDPDISVSQPTSIGCAVACFIRHSQWHAEHSMAEGLRGVTEGALLVLHKGCWESA